VEGFLREVGDRRRHLRGNRQRRELLRRGEAGETLSGAWG
jgi:hypothetical protein